ncbi:MAG TPA: hypothetical protein VH518_15870 [Tepidisphaeraceae bacterium]|jgi:hypothetical protein
MWNRICLILTLLSVAGGCSSSQPPRKAAAGSEEPVVVVLASYEPARAGALVFDPPVISDQPPLDLARDDRNPGAFVGYESLTSTFFYVRTDDLQGDQFGRNGSLYQRRAVQVKTGVSYR